MKSLFAIALVATTACFPAHAGLYGCNFTSSNAPVLDKASRELVFGNQRRARADKLGLIIIGTLAVFWKFLRSHLQKLRAKPERVLAPAFFREGSR